MQQTIPLDGATNPFGPQAWESNSQCTTEISLIVFIIATDLKLHVKMWTSKKLDNWL